MYGFKKGDKPEAQEDQGGMIEGPGTGTSDSIKKKIPKGAYIMPADSTKKVGPDAMAQLGKPTPVNVSNGEYQIPPEKVHAVGVQALNQVRDATTSVPPAAGFGPQQAQRGELFFVRGGSPSDEEEVARQKDPNAPRIERMEGRGMYEQANADLGNAVGQAFPNTATAIRGAGDNIAQSYQQGGVPAAIGATVRNTMVPAIGFGADVARGFNDAIIKPAGTMLRTAITGNAAPVGAQPKPEAPAVTPTAPATPKQNAVAPTEQATQPANFDTLTDDQRSAAGDAYRSAWQNQAPGGLRSADAQALDMYNTEQQVRGTGINAQRQANGVMEFSGQNVSKSPSGSFSQGIGTPTPGGFGALQRAAGMQAGNAQIQQNRMDGRADGWTPTRTSPEQQSAIYAQNKANENADRERLFLRPAGEKRYLDEAKQAGDMVAQQARETGQNERLNTAERGQNTRTAASNALEQQRIAGDQQIKGFQAQGLQRMEKLYSAYESAKTPEERTRIAEQIRTMNGKDTEQQNRFTVVPGGQEVDPTTGMPITRPSMVINNQTGEFVNQQGGQQLPPIAQNPAALKIAQNTALSREERAAQLRALGYQ